MTPPGIAAGRFAGAFALGLALGIVHAFLAPLGRKRRWPGDLIFLLCALWAWLYLAFGLCRGDPRGAYLPALWLGAWAANELFRGFFHRFWKILAFPAKKILKITKN